MNAVSNHLRAAAAARRAAAGEQPGDPRHARSAAALEALADHADASAERGDFPLRYLLDHHVADGGFAWPEGQSGRAIAQFGFDVPVNGAWDLEQFLYDLCDLAKSDAARHIGSNEGTLQRADADALGRRFGLSVERVHHALDSGRGYAQLWIVGVPAEHDVDASARAALEAIDGVIVAPGRAQDYGPAPPLLVKNIPADDELAARGRVADIVAIDPAALGVVASARVLPATAT